MLSYPPAHYRRSRLVPLYRQPHINSPTSSSQPTLSPSTSHHISLLCHPSFSLLPLYQPLLSVQPQPQPQPQPHLHLAHTHMRDDSLRLRKSANQCTTQQQHATLIGSALKPIHHSTGSSSRNSLTKVMLLHFVLWLHAETVTNLSTLGEIEIGTGWYMLLFRDRETLLCR
eukprot:scaffold4471_cov114-Skeletonema_marinoi.AAC.2